VSGTPMDGNAVWASPRMTPPTSTHEKVEVPPPLIYSLRRIVSGVKIHIEHDCRTGRGTLGWAPWRRREYQLGEYEPPLYGWYEEFLKEVYK
jgi:hypothetical protein